MSRDLYRVAHKAMRQDLFEVSAMIGTTDFSSPTGVDALRQRFSGLVASMGHHAELEDNELHPILDGLDSPVLVSIQAEHETLDAELESLARTLAHLDIGDDGAAWAAAHQFYLRFNRYVADYLHHIDREERELMPVLADAVEAERLDQLAQADYEGPVEMLVGAMSNMMPLFNLDDRRQVIADISAARTPVDFEAVATAGRTALGDAEWERIVG